MRASLLIVASCFWSTVAAAQQLGDLKITFQAKGDIPKAKVIRGVPAGAAMPINDDSLVINTKNQGVANVLVHVYTGTRGGTQLPKQEHRNYKQTVTCRNFSFDPHFIVAQVGDTVEFVNSDPVAQIVNVAFLRNSVVNLVLSANQSREIALKLPEPSPMPVSSGIHPWMKGWIAVLDHPFASLSDENGELTIKNLPAGDVVVFRAFHERAKFSEKIFVNGNQVQWVRNRFEVPIKPGLNDFGIVQIPSDQFK